MKYITINELNNTIRNNLYKIPHDTDFVIGIPRSGMLVATIISELLNIPLIDINSFVDGIQPGGGNRVGFNEKRNSGKVLVIDDTCYNGNSMLSARRKLNDIKGYNFIYGVAYLEGNGINAIDFYLDDVRQYTKGDCNIVLYEWNIFHHYNQITEKFMYDMDGVLCVEPPDERQKEKYEEYIKEAIPLFLPTTKIGTIVTYRLKKYEAVTKKWLDKNKVKYDKLYMFPANSYDERAESGKSPSKMKADIYVGSDALLFIESSDIQAKEINKITNKPVLSVEKNVLYT